VLNTGDADATGVTVTDVYETDELILSGMISGNEPDTSIPGTLTWTGLTVGSGSSTVVEFEMIVVTR